MLPHDGTYTTDGPAEEPYINHLLEVEVPQELIAEHFGDDVAATKLGKIARVKPKENERRPPTGPPFTLNSPTVCPFGLRR